jgi:actin-related protein
MGEEEKKSIKLITPMNARYGAWFGGSVLAGLPAFAKLAVPRTEYDETGRAVLNRMG